MVNPLGKIRSQSDGVSKTEGERYPMRAFQPDTNGSSSMNPATNPAPLLKSYYRAGCCSTNKNWIARNLHVFGSPVDDVSFTATGMAMGSVFFASLRPNYLKSSGVRNRASLAGSIS